MNSPFTDTRILSPPTQSACICVVSFYCAPQPSATVLGERSKYIQSFSSFFFIVYITLSNATMSMSPARKCLNFTSPFLLPALLSASLCWWPVLAKLHHREWNHNLAIHNPLELTWNLKISPWTNNSILSSMLVLIPSKIACVDLLIYHSISSISYLIHAKDTFDQQQPTRRCSLETAVLGPPNGRRNYARQAPWLLSLWWSGLQGCRGIDARRMIKNRPRHLNNSFMACLREEIRK